ncbi:Fic family protein (plasmid) [Sulfurimonas aquatica]|uniref:Fic family protein n=1 Tax=Sulfurimonas aquatica TaxID=2672570 RepID=A0A975GE54_9BACT|nr:Fic family protein [Sulfurimonas aquatica]QSZ43148.1 Fic family protein [Sulfurimonas aquatica]
MSFTPIAPTDIKGNIDSALLDKANKLLIEAAKLEGSHTPQILQAVKNLLYSVNSYYSNRIESESTHIIDIEKAMQQDYSKDIKKRNLQILSLTHIEVQKECEEYFKNNPSTSAYNKEFILNIHKSFYSKNGMEPFLDVTHDGMHARITPGKIRERDVKVGNHLAPNPNKLDNLLNEFEHLYNKSLNTSHAVQLIHILSSHHRLMWIHPFLDGNGRTARLALNSALSCMGMSGYGLWNISRGLARNSTAYKSNLSYADMPRQGERDGRGALSSNSLARYVDFMLDISLDQVAYMNTHLKLNSLTKKIELYVKRVNDGLHGIDPLPNHSEKIFKYLLLSGECARGKIPEIIGMKDRTASRVIAELLKRNFIESDSKAGPIRLKIGASMASFLFPMLVPEAEEY